MNSHFHICPTCCRKFECNYGTCTAPNGYTARVPDGQPVRATDWHQNVSPDSTQCERCHPGAAEVAHRREILRRLKPAPKPDKDEWFMPGKGTTPQVYAVGGSYQPRFGPFIDKMTSAKTLSKPARAAVSNMRNRSAVREKRQQLRRARPRRPPPPPRR